MSQHPIRYTQHPINLSNNSAVSIRSAVKIINSNKSIYIIQQYYKQKNGVDKIRGKLISAMICIIIISSLLISGDFRSESLSSPIKQPSTRSSESTHYDNWSEAIPLSLIDDSDAKNPEIEVYNNYVHVIWEENYNIFYRRSEDYGNNWSDIKTLVDSIEYNVTTPAIAVEGGNIYVVWIDEEIIIGDNMNEIEDIYGEIYYKYSLNNGKTWSNDFKIAGNHSHFPCLAVNNNKIHIVWSENTYFLTADLTTLYDFEIYYMNFIINELGIPILLDESNSPFYVNWYTPHVKIAIEGNNIHVVWADGNLDPSYSYIRYINSKDEGTNWNGVKNITDFNRQGYLNPTINVYNTNIYVVYLENNHLDISIQFIYSPDNGNYWSKSKLLSENSSEYNLEAPDIETYNENIYIVFSKENVPKNNEIFMMTSFNCGVNWNNMTQITYNLTGPWYPKIGIGDEYLQVIWLDESKSVNELFYKHHHKETTLQIDPFLINVTIFEDNYYKQVFDTFNAIGNVIWHYESNASWLNWDQKNHTIFGTPTNDDVGKYWVTIKAIDNNGSKDEQNFTLIVLNVNDPPIISNAPKNITVIQPETQKLNLSSYIYDVDNPKSDLTLQTSSEYVQTEGLELIFDYRYSNLWYENVTINVSDGEMVSTNHNLEVEILVVDAWNVEVTDYLPKGNNVSIFSNITITFNRLMNYTTCENAFSITPIVEGDFYWDYGILIFDPITFLNFNTTYIVTLSTTATSHEGHPLNARSSWNFKTEHLTGTDSDNDGYPDSLDAFPDDPNYYLDTDQDGMPNAWEDKHRLNKTDPADALHDPDNDDKPNKDEFEDGTDPLISDVEEDENMDYTIFIAINILIVLIIVIILVIKVKMDKIKKTPKKK